MLSDVPAYNPRQHKHRLAWREFYSIFCALNRRAELLRLVAWAKRKRLTRPQKLYESRLRDIEKLLLLYALHSPHLARSARTLHQLSRLVFPAPRYFPQGSAAIYRTR